MKYSYKIPCSTNHLRDLRKFLSGILGNLDMKNVDDNALILAVDEVCANIIIHSNCEETEFIEMTVDVKENLLIFEIIDGSANSFDINAYHEPKIKDIIKTRRKGGFGLMLVKRIMDKIEIENSKGKNICRLYKTIK